MPSAIKAEMVKRMAFAAMQKRPERALLLLLLVLASHASAVPLPLVCDLTSEEDPAFVIQQTQSSSAKHLVLSIRRYHPFGHCSFVCRRQGLEPLQTSSQTSGDEPRPVRWLRQPSPFVETQTPRVFIQQGTA